MDIEQSTKINNYCHNIGYDSYTLKWLQILCSTQQDVKNFTKNFYTGNKEREMFDVFNYRLHLLRSREYSFNQFSLDMQKDIQSALQTLCLCPVSSIDTEIFNKSINNNEFTLKDFYLLQKDKPKYNFIKLLNWIRFY